MRRVTFLFSFFALVATETLSQAQSVALPRPDSLAAFDKCLGPQAAARSATRSREWWRVWVDRENVPVFADEELKSRVSVSLGFLDAFYVAKVSVDRSAMQLLKSDMPPYGPSVTGTIVGWVRTENLVLGTSSVRADSSIPKRAFVINDWKKFDNATAAEIRNNQVTVRTAPSATARAVRTLSGTDSPFSYIYKYDVCGKPGWFLVGKSSALNQLDEPGDVILGWIPKSRAAEWDTREAWEPDPARKSPAHVFLTEAAMAANNTRDAFIDRMQRERLPADKWRYVHLAQGANTKEVKVGFFGDLLVVDDGAGGTTTVPADASLGREIQDFYAGPLTNINVIFAMDGSRSMGAYLNRVADTAERIMGSLKDVTKKVKISYGAVVYRDLRNTLREQFAIQPLTGSVQEVARFLKAQREPSAGDDDYEEALFAGIQKALDLAQPGKKNILIVVGDAGNSDKKQVLNDKAIREALSKKTTYIYALQIQKPPENADEKVAQQKFEPDMRRILGLVSSVRDPRLAQLAKTWPQTGRMPEEARATIFEKTAQGAQNLQEVGDKIALEIRKSTMIAKGMEEMFPTCIDQGFDKCLGSPPPSPSPTKSTTGDPTQYEIVAALLDLMAQEVENPAIMRQMIRDKVQIFQAGWVKVQDNSGPLMKPMYLVGQDELLLARSILDEFSRFGGADAATLAVVWKDRIKQACGCETDNPEEYIQMRSAFQFKELSSFLSRDWPSIANAKTDEITNFLKQAKASIARLDKLRGDETIWFKNWGQKFAWVSAEDLP